MSIKVLIIEDELSLQQTIKLNLELENYNVETCGNGGEAISIIKKFTPDLILLDIMLPVIGGIEIYKQLKDLNNNTPVIFLTAKNNVQDKIEGLKLGADDYITKPFSMEELLLRMDNIFKRLPKTEVSDQNEFKIGKFDFNNTNRTLTLAGNSVKLTTKESELLKMLALHIDRVLEREVALNAVWGTDSYFAGRSMDVYIAKLRKYLKEDPNVEVLNIHGTGFKMIIKK